LLVMSAKFALRTQFHKKKVNNKESRYAV